MPLEKQQRRTQPWRGLLGIAGGRRSVGPALPPGASHGRQHSLVSTDHPASPHRRPLDSDPAQQFLLKAHRRNYPLLLWAILRDSNRFSRASRGAGPRRSIDHWARETVHTLDWNPDWKQGAHRARKPKLGMVGSASTLTVTRNPVNRVCHTVGIPMIALGVLVNPTHYSGIPASGILAVGLFVVGWIFQIHLVTPLRASRRVLSGLAFSLRWAPLVVAKIAGKA